MLLHDLQICLDLQNRCLLFFIGSPSLHDPSTDFFNITYNRLKQYVPFSEFMPKIYALDGPKETLTIERIHEYDRYIAAIRKGFPDVEICKSRSYGMLTGSLDHALRGCVRTKYVFLNQDDLAISQPIDMMGLLAAMNENTEIKTVAFTDRSNHPKHCATTWRSPFDNSFCWTSHYYEYEKPTPCPLTKVMGFTDRLHLTSRSRYLDFLLPLARGHPYVEFSAARAVAAMYNPDFDRAQRVVSQAAEHAGTHLTVNEEQIDWTGRWPESWYTHWGSFMYGNTSFQGSYYEHLDRRCKGGKRNATTVRSDHVIKKNVYREYPGPVPMANS